MTSVLVSELVLAVGLGTTSPFCSNPTNSAQLEIARSSLGVSRMLTY